MTFLGPSFTPDLSLDLKSPNLKGPIVKHDRQNIETNH